MTAILLCKRRRSEEFFLQEKEKKEERKGRKEGGRRGSNARGCSPGCSKITHTSHFLFSIISFKPDNSVIAKAICLSMFVRVCMCAGWTSVQCVCVCERDREAREASGCVVCGSGTPQSIVITDAALKWWNVLVGIISRLRCTHTLFTFPLKYSFTPPLQ